MTGKQEQTIGSFGNCYLYKSYYYDVESGLYYLNARYYDPSIGRFLSRDPNGASEKDRLEQNPYLYVKNNPVNSEDPSGLKSAYWWYRHNKYLYAKTGKLRYKARMGRWYNIWQKSAKRDINKAAYWKGAKAKTVERAKPKLTQSQKDDMYYRLLGGRGAVGAGLSMGLVPKKSVAKVAGHEPAHVAVARKIVKASPSRSSSTLTSKSKSQNSSSQKPPFKSFNLEMTRSGGAGPLELGLDVIGVTAEATQVIAIGGAGAATLATKGVAAPAAVPAGLTVVSVARGVEIGADVVALGYSTYKWSRGEATLLDVAVNFGDLILPYPGTSVASLAYDVYSPLYSKR